MNASSDPHSPSNNNSSSNEHSLNPNDYNPISNLEQQYAHAPLGRRIILIIKLNESCIVPGGVDTVLKYAKASGSPVRSASGTSLSGMNGAGGGTGGGGSSTVDGVTMTVADPSLITEDMNDLSLRGTNGGGVDHQLQAQNGDSPFDFLNNTEDGQAPPPPTSTPTSKNFKSMSSMFAKAKNQFERGVTSIAVQAHKATTGSNNAEIRDIITVGAYLQDSSSGEYNTCLGMTERFSMPSKKNHDLNGTNSSDGDVPDVIDMTNTTSDGNDGEGITFQIPIILSPDLVDPNNHTTNANLNIQFRLWMRSGAAIFAKSRALRRYYSAGSAYFPLGLLIQAIQPKLTRPVVLNVPVQSSVIANGKLSMVAVPDTKFPPLCGNGWSMSDPRTDTAYTPTVGKKILFNPPLDQNYIFPVPQQLDMTNSSTSSSVLLTTERTTESTLTLPLAIAYTELVHKAAEKSTAHAMELNAKLQCLHGPNTIHDPMKALQLGHAQVNVEVLHFLRYTANNGGNGDSGGGSVNVMINLQRPDSIFENCIASGMVPSQPYFPNASYPQHPSISVPFYPRVVLASDPRLLPGEAKSNKTFHVGKLRFDINEQGVGGAGADVFSPIGPAGSVGTAPRHMEAIVDIDTYVNKKEEMLIQASVVDLKSGGAVGLLIVKIAASTLEGMVDHASNDIATSVTGKRSGEYSLVEDGLISFVGLDTLMEDDKACYPHSDLDSEAAKRVFGQVNQNSSAAERLSDRRKRQIATMGEFLTYNYLNNHARGNRMGETNYMNEKFEAYKVALFTPPSSVEVEEEELTPDKRRDPRPFRPSSSRKEPLLSSIGFNVHVQNFCVTTITTDHASGKCSAASTGLFKNVTCGAPADHFRGFGDKESSFSGGLRRLESMRVTTAQYVRDSQDKLIEAVGAYFSAQSQCTNVHLPGRSTRHISPSNIDISSLRTSCIAATQKLHTLTWEIAVRRANVFSQALGIALTMYLTHVSDSAKLQKGAWAELWKKHGFLLCFEGLLSAAGKELGMIEDAAVGIAMLRMVSVVFVTEANMAGNEKGSSCIPVADSPYLKWVRINPSGIGANTRYLVELCVDRNFYVQKIPGVLKGKTQVQFYPILYEMGVDIRQWGSNAANFNKGNNANNQEELDDDEVGVPDNDVLIALNYEAFRKMNAYAHSVYRCNEDPSVSWEQANSESATPQPIHPMLNDLFEFIKSSAGKMEHGILDEAAHAAAKLGGGAALFCKSGKDRTAMQVTFKQSQYINRYLKTGGNGHSDDCELDNDKVFADSTLMRVYGTRLPICDKNVGQPLYAFNSLQARFMPDALKPPPRALAGFLKGGRLFRGEPLIES